MTDRIKPIDIVNVGMFQKHSDQVAMNAEIVREIDRRFREDMNKRGLDGQTIEYMAPVSGNQVWMAWIACYASYSINGVAALHTEIIKHEQLSRHHLL